MSVRLGADWLGWVQCVRLLSDAAAADQIQW